MFIMLSGESDGERLGFMARLIASSFFWLRTKHDVARIHKAPPPPALVESHHSPLVRAKGLGFATLNLH